MVRSIINYYHNNSAKLLLSLLFFVLALMIFVGITNEIVLEKEETMDFLVFKFFKRYLISDQLTGSMYALTQLSSVVWMKIAYPLLIGILTLFKLYRKALFTFVAGTGGLVIIYVMKMFFQRPRPPYPILYREESFSFPSGHATFSFIFYGTLAYFIWLTDVPKIGVLS